MRTGKQRFSVVCVYNNRDRLDRYLLKGLSEQEVPCETILIDNTDGRIRSAASAYNSVLGIVSGQYVIFSHQDVYLGRPDTLESIHQMLRGFGDRVVAGVAGKKPWGTTLTNITHGDPPVPAGKAFDRIERVQTLDGCFFAVSGKLLEEQKFDAQVCDGWHLYAVDYCLSVRRGVPVVVLPLDGIYHFSKGPSDRGSIDRAITRISAKHRGYVRRVFSTCGDWPTEIRPLFFKIFRDRFRKRVKAFFTGLFGSSFHRTQ